MTAERDALAEFTEYVVTNYPPRTIISDPAWHAPKLFRAAERAIAARAVLAAPAQEPMTAPPREQYCTHARICDKRGNRCVIDCGLPERWMVAAPTVAQPAEPPHKPCPTCGQAIPARESVDEWAHRMGNVLAATPSDNATAEPVQPCIACPCPTKCTRANWCHIQWAAQTPAEPPATDALVARLRRLYDEHEDVCRVAPRTERYPACDMAEACRAAADAITALRAENERQAREIAAVKDERDEFAIGYSARERERAERAEAECEKLRAAIAGMLADIDSNIDAARAKVQP